MVMCIGHSNGYCHGNMYTPAMGTEVFAIVMGIDHVVCLLHLLDYPTCKKSLLNYQFPLNSFPALQ